MIESNLVHLIRQGAIKWLTATPPFEDEPTGEFLINRMASLFMAIVLTAQEHPEWAQAWNFTIRRGLAEDAGCEDATELCQEMIEWFSVPRMELLPNETR